MIIDRTDKETGIRVVIDTGEIPALKFYFQDQLVDLNTMIISKSLLIMVGEMTREIKNGEI